MVSLRTDAPVEAGESAGISGLRENAERSRRHTQSTPATILINRYEKIELESQKPRNAVQNDPREIVPRMFLITPASAANRTAKTSINKAPRIALRDDDT